MSIDVAVIGAGAAGVAAAERLKRLRPALSIQILEAGERIGGRAWTIPAPGLPSAAIDLGCGWLHGARTNAWTAIAEQLGQEVDRTPAPWDRESRDWGLGEADARAASAAVAAFFARIEARPPGTADTSLAAYLEPDGRWNGFLEAIGTYLAGAPLPEVSAEDFDRYDPGPSPDWRLPGGYGTLVRTFAKDLPVRLGVAATLIRHDAPSGVRIETNAGEVEAKAVIVTVSTNVLAAEKLRFDPPLPDKAEAAAALPLGLANKLFIAIEAGTAIEAEKQVFGKPGARDTASYLLRPFGQDLIEAYFGGTLALDIEKAGPAGALAFAADELAGHFGSAIRSRLSFAAMSGWAAQPHVGGSYSYAVPGKADCRGDLAEPVEGRIFFAGEACSRGRFSTAHGAYESGVAAADALLASLAAG